MLMHRVTFPMLAWVSLDAAGVLTEHPPETGGGETQNTSAPTLSSSFHLHSSK